MNTGPTHDMVLGIIEDKDSTQEEIGSFYANAIDRWYVDRDSVDFAILNRAILQRYKPSGLNRIKRIGWQHARTVAR